MKKFCLFAAIVITLLNFSCSNFMNGADLKDDLEKITNRASSPYINFLMQNDVSQGTTVPAANSYKNQYKALDKESISFTARDDYQFLYWQVSPAGVIKFDDVKSASTKIEFLKGADVAESVVIMPVCAERPYPSVDPSAAGGDKSKNISVIINFGKVIQNPESDLSLIDIQIAGESVLKHYHNPVFTNDKRSILFDADDENLLPFTSGTKSVNVLIPNVFYYTTPDGTKIQMAKDVSSNFTINYTTKEFAKLSADVENSSAGKLNRSGEFTMYMGETFTLIYTMSQGYQFGGWKAELGEGSEGNLTEADGKIFIDGSEVLEVIPNGEDFDEEYYASVLNKYQRTYKVLKACRGVVIKPVYYKKSEITSILPKNTETVAKNSAIEIDFSKPMNITDEDAKKITITCDGIDASSHFNPAVIEADSATGNTRIYFTANRSNLMSISSGTKTITVTIPESFCYTENGVDVTLASSYSYSYVVDNSTIDKVYLKFESNNDYGKLSTSEPKTLYLDDEYQVSFVPNANQIIKGWLCYRENDSEKNPVASSVLSVSESEDKQTLSIKVVSGCSDNIIVTPLLKSKTEAIITVGCDYGTGSTTPEGIVNKNYSGNVLSLSFKENSDYQFIRWEIVSSDEAVKNKFTLNNSDKLDASISIGNLDAAGDTNSEYKISVKAVCAERPKVVSATPTYDANGVYRDRRIIVMFDNFMTTDSIYYSEEERNKITAANPGKTVNWKNTFITLDESGNSVEKETEKYYGYQIDDGEIIFKNITITDRKTKKNLLKNFTGPYFDEFDSSVLRIDTKLGENAPPSVTDVMVTIGHDFCLKTDNNEYVKLSSDYRWAYFTNSRVDTDPPEFLTTDSNELNNFSVQFAADNQVDFVSAHTHCEKNSASFNVTVSDKDDNVYSKNNLRNRKLWVKGTFSDVGSGPSYLKWNVWKVNSEYYPQSEEKAVDSGKIVDLEIAGQNAEIKRLKSDGKTYSNGVPIELSPDMDEGLYRIDFIAVDKNEKTATKSYYFVYDVKGPAKIENFAESRTTSGKATLSWTKPAESDYFNTLVWTQAAANGSQMSVAAGADSENKFADENSKTFNVTDFVRYEYVARAYDIVGNVSEDVYFTDTQKPSSLKNLLESRTESGKATVSWTRPGETDFGKIEIVRHNATNESVSDVTDTIPYTATTSSTYNVTDFNRYLYTAKVYDFSGNVSDEVTFTDDVPPVYTANPSLSYEFGKVTVIWNLHDTTELGRINIEYKKFGETTPETHLTDSTVKTYIISPFNITISTKSLPISMYRRGKRYTYSVYYEDWSGNKSTVESVNTAHYINDEGTFTVNGSTKTRSGNMVINDVEIPYSELIPINEAIIPRNGSDGTYTDYKEKGIFRYSRKKDFKLSKYQLGQWEVTTDLWSAVRSQNEYRSSIRNGTSWIPGNVTTLGDHYALGGINWCYAVEMCNELSRLMGMEPCYTITYNSKTTADLSYAEYDYAQIPHYTSDSGFDQWNSIQVDISKDGFRLPTIAEWEYAARGANTSNKSQWYSKYGGTNSLSGYANYGGSTSTKVGNYKPNAAGFYDIYGNVSELTNDRWSSNKWFIDDNLDIKLTSGGYICNPVQNTGTKYEHARMGGDYGSKEAECSWQILSSNCNDGNPSNIQNYLGMRLCRTVK